MLAHCHVSKSSGTVKSSRSGPTAMLAELSTVWVRHLNPTQAPENRDMAKPNSPKSMYSCTEAGWRTGIISDWKACSDWPARVEDAAPWSSPTSASTPPWGAVPAELAWRMASIERSSPGALPYQMPNTPSWRAPA